jgi:hypothetical protein
MVAAWMSAATMACAGINISWLIAWGVYDFGTPEGQLSSFNAGTGILNPGGSTIFQIILWGGNLQHAADPGTPNYLTGGDTLLDAPEIITEGGEVTEWAWDNTQNRYTNSVYTPGSVFLRIFQDHTPAIGEHYYDTDLVPIQDITSLAEDDAQVIYLEPDPANKGVALDRTLVPEPSVLAFLGVGVILFAARRVRRRLK